jgi:iron(III) transport system ATP-binding protein
MRDGRLEQIAAPEDCFRDPATRFVAEFLGEASFLPGEASGGVVTTAIGQAEGRGAEGAVAALVRPDDLALQSDPAGNGAVAWARYEGGSRLFGVDLDCGVQVRIRTNHEVNHAPGEAVSVTIAAGHPLALFPAQQAADSEAPAGAGRHRHPTHPAEGDLPESVAATGHIGSGG